MEPWPVDGRARSSVDAGLGPRRSRAPGPAQPWPGSPRLQSEGWPGVHKYIGALPPTYACQSGVPSESTLPSPPSRTPSTKSKTSLSPPTPIRERNGKLRLSPSAPTVAHWHEHATSIISDGGVFLGTDLLVEGNTPQTCRYPPREELARLGVQHQRPHGHGPNISSSYTKCHQQPERDPIPISCAGVLGRSR